eukprot:CAMPEP_0176198622 /NCGR_PEP_ID=MMETSP0121_2-20121125/8146_1 /TAXON_ID=160619 /ORGANISM="Kryptoperidinium foliaceum, Strain CCMP 1326" /LENGTH=159 /DNA_ID=CAMNT_0017537475 /DNA_START=165 /DNA_END=644 /DNA_ORIENTATION=-
MSGLLNRVAGMAARMQPVPAAGSQACASWAKRANPVYPSPWNKWFPYEPVPSTPQIGPYRVQCAAKETYHFCTCGESTTQPWCESPGARCAKVPEFAPRPYQPQHDGMKLMCGCKKAPDSFCNGSCALLYADLNPYVVSAAGFGGCFVFGLFYTWMMHP